MADERLVPQGQHGSGADRGSPEKVSETEGPPTNPHVRRVGRRRWAHAFLCAFVVCAICLLLIWLLVRPQYTATGALEVAPVVQHILYDDGAALPSYEAYIKTQAALITSKHVLLQVVEDPRIRSLPWVREAPDPVEMLTGVLRAEAIPGTHLLQVSMTGTDSTMVAEVVNATTRAYMKVQGSDEASTRDHRLTILQQERAAAAEKMRSLNERLAEFRRVEDEVDERDVEAGTRDQGAVALGRAQVELDSATDLHKTISQRIQQLRVERQRPARIRVAYFAEVPKVPSRDKRWKYSIMVPVGAILVWLVCVLLLPKRRTHKEDRSLLS